MVSRLARYLCSLAVVVAPLAAEAQTVRLPVEKYKLENGLEVILHEDHRTPTVAINVWYHVGSKDEARGKNGFAHLFEHVMFQGSRHVGEDMFFKYLERAGVSDRNGTTNADRTNYYETLPSNQLELALWLESDRMAFLLDHADQKTFENQREVVKNERRQNYENAPYGQVWSFVREALYSADHPYRLLTIGTPKDLDAASLDDVKSFFKTYYLPNNASLVIAGDFKPEQAKELVSKYFGPVVRGADPPVKTRPVPSDLAATKVLKVEADVELARLYLTWPSPPAFTQADAELDAVALLLEKGKSSRLYRRLVRELQIAQDVSAYQSSMQLGSDFDIIVTLRKGKDPGEAQKVVDEELEKLRTAPPSDAEVERARAQLLSQLVFDSERITSRANRFNHYNQYTGDPNFFEKDVARYKALKGADLSKAVATYLPADKRVITVVVPTAGAPRAGRLAEAR